jgi:NAD(P)H-binding
VQHALAKGYEVVGVCRQQSIGKLDAFKGRITIFPGMTDDREVIKRAVADCDGVLTVLVPWGMNHYATKTAQAVLDCSKPGARLVFSCGWHITRDGLDVYSRRLKAIVWVFRGLARLFRIADLDDQVEACARVFASDKSWTVVRGSDLEEGDSEGLPAWSRHVGDPILSSNRTRRVDFALFMVEALANDALIHEAPAIVGCRTWSARTYSNRIESPLPITGKPSSGEINETLADPAERGLLRYFYQNWRPTRLGRVWSRAFAWVSGLGLTPQILTTLQVREQGADRLESTVLVAANHQDQRYLVSMLGNGSGWVRNVRAANGEAFIKRGQTRKVKLTEIPTEQRAPILKAWCQVATSGRKHLPVAPDAPVTAFEAIAADYPVFRIDPA